MENYFVELNSIDCSDKVEHKNGLSYLSWAWAWQQLKSIHPDATYTIYENAEGWNYHTDGRTAWVKTGVTVNGIEHIEYLPVMDYRNKSIPLESVTSFDVNKSIQRSLTKSVARHGLGLWLYSGEDLPPNKSDKVSAMEARIITEMLEKSESDIEKFKDHYRINAVEELTATQYVEASKMLSKKLQDMGVDVLK